MTGWKRKGRQTSGKYSQRRWNCEGKWKNSKQWGELQKLVGQVRKNCISTTVVQCWWKWEKNYNTLAKQLEKNMKLSLFSSQHTSVACKWYCRKVTLLLIFRACHAGDERGPGLSRNYTPISPQGNSVQNSSSAKTCLRKWFELPPPTWERAGSQQAGKEPSTNSGEIPSQGYLSGSSSLNKLYSPFCL